MRVSTFIFSLLLILTGAAMALVELDYTTWEQAVQLQRLWPLVLVVAGVSLFWGGRIPSWLALFLVIAITGGIIVFLVYNHGINNHWRRNHFVLQHAPAVPGQVNSRDSFTPAFDEESCQAFILKEEAIHA